MLPVYDPKSFASIDLRKYHIRNVNDVIKFHEFVASRMEEAQFILKKFNTQLATFQSVSNQLRKKQEEQQAVYGSAQSQEAVEKPAEIQKVEEDTMQKEHENLLKDIREAAAEEKLAEEIEESDSDEPLEAILGKYKMVYGKKGPMFYRENETGRRVLVSKADVPEDIKQQLLAAVDKDE